MQKYAAYMQIYADFCLCGINFAYAILKMPYICGKICDIQVLAKYTIAYSHITNIPNH